VGIAPCRTTYHAALRIDDANTAHTTRALLGEIGSISVLTKVCFLNNFLVYELLLMRDFFYYSEEFFMAVSELSVDDFPGSSISDNGRKIKEN
jgi:hypothetical protein